MTLHLLYVHTTKIGYARYGVKLREGLERLGVEIDDTLNHDSTPSNVVCWVAPPGHTAGGWFKGQYPVISTMWEARQLPEQFREAFHQFPLIIVPSEQNRELFSRYHDNVVKVNLGIDSDEWHYRKRRPPTDRFVFLIGGSGSRKGQDLAFKAFRRVFKTWPRDMPVPVLQFKSPKPTDFVGERIEHIGGYISDEAECDLYGAAHCYLQPSRGEGFGLQPLQAIAQGMPTILTDAHGQAEYAHLGYPLSTTASKAAYFIYGEAGDWWEPSLDELCQYMEHVYYNYDKACLRAEEMSAVAHDEFNWDKISLDFLNALGRDNVNAPYKGDGTWFKPDIKKYLIRVNRPWAADVAGSHYQFVPGEDYFAIADIKRILYECDVLDPTCILPQPSDALVEGYRLSEAEMACGLTETQLGKLEGYVKKQSYCWTCHQVLGSGVQYEPDVPVSNGALLL
jgi:hypothetical protein